MSPRRVAVFLILVASPVLAQQDPDIERGFKAAQSYETAANFDVTNLFNGTVNLTIPLREYAVGGTLKYGFTVYGATNSWDLAYHDVDRYPLDPLELRYTYPWKHGQAGLGWILSLGKVHNVSVDTGLYVGPTVPSISSFASFIILTLPSNRRAVSYQSGTWTSVRKTYRKYEGDAYLDGGTAQSELNQRLSFEKIVYEDNSWTSTTFSDFDGLGHYRYATTTGLLAERQALTSLGYQPVHVGLIMVQGELVQVLEWQKIK